MNGAAAFAVQVVEGVDEGAAIRRVAHILHVGVGVDTNRHWLE